NVYRLTEKGVALGPVMLELLIWSARHEKTGAPCEMIEHLASNREAALTEAYRRWKERDLTPLIPPFEPLPGRDAKPRPRRSAAAGKQARSAGRLARSPRQSSRKSSSEGEPS